jgi:hypothetical protein
MAALQRAGLISPAAAVDAARQLQDHGIRLSKPLPEWYLGQLRTAWRINRRRH